MVEGRGAGAVVQWRLIIPLEQSINSDVTVEPELIQQKRRVDDTVYSCLPGAVFLNT